EGEVTQERSAQQKEGNPYECAGHVEEHEAVVIHSAGSGHERGVGAYDRDEPRDHDRLPPISFEETLRAIQMLCFQEAEAPVEGVDPHLGADPVVDLVADDRSHQKEKIERDDAQSSLRGQGSRREEERVAWQERRYDQPGLAEYDQE